MNKYLEEANKKAEAKYTFWDHVLAIIAKFTIGCVVGSVIFFWATRPIIYISWEALDETIVRGATEQWYLPLTFGLLGVFLFGPILRLLGSFSGRN